MISWLLPQGTHTLKGQQVNGHPLGASMTVLLHTFGRGASLSARTPVGQGGCRGQGVGGGLEYSRLHRLIEVSSSPEGWSTRGSSAIVCVKSEITNQTAQLQGGIPEKNGSSRGAAPYSRFKMNKHTPSGLASNGLVQFLGCRPFRLHKMLPHAKMHGYHSELRQALRLQRAQAGASGHCPSPLQGALMQYATI